MARDFEAGSSEILVYNNVFDATADNLTIAFWVNRESTANGYIVNFNNSDNTAFAATALFANGGQNLQLQVNYGTTDLAVRTSTTIGTGSWIHLCLAWPHSVTASSTGLYINGSADTHGLDTNGVGAPAEAATGQVTIGGRNWSTAIYYDGLLAEVGVWDRILDASEIAQLADGFAPSFMARNLRAYWPLVRNTNEIKASTALASSTGTVAAAHPRIIYPAAPNMTYYTPVVAGARYFHRQILAGVG